MPVSILLLLLFGHFIRLALTHHPLLALCGSHLGVVRAIVSADEGREEGWEEEGARRADWERSLWLAVGAGRKAIAELLLLHGKGVLDWRRRDSKGRSLTELARARRHDDCHTLLQVKGGAGRALGCLGRVCSLACVCGACWQWFEGEQWRLYGVVKARAVVDETEVVRQAPGKAGVSE